MLGFLDKKRETEQRDKIVAYKHVFATPQGRTILFDLMNRYHILNPHDAEAYSEGQRSVVLEILRLANINLEEFDKLLKGEL